MPGPEFLRGDAVSLHPVEEDDLPFLQRHRNDPAIRSGMTTATPQNGYEAEQAHERHSGDDSGVGLLIVPREQSSADDAAPDPVGNVVCFGIDETHGTGELACWITPDEQGNGYGKAGTERMLDHVFDDRRLHKVVARALVGNTPSRATLESIGFVEEGVQRDEKYVNGEFRDVVRYSMLAREWGDD
ncbi:GNAT family N-acetyltransferase [Halorarius litoreus]|uniref:GNAT family N-acetyltransferase n=1 Tax=Halorarius litoreus TaxID=2962676 RepID=UPI0020CDC603|nr:GNAT family protein [Halorarius litoreus]